MADATEAVQEKAEVQSEQPQEQVVEGQGNSKRSAQAVEFSEARESADSGGGGSLDVLLDMEIPVTVAIGQTEIPVRRLLQLGPGSVVKLNKPIDAPVDLYLRDTKFATGAVVVVDGYFAVKIREIIGLDGPSGSGRQGRG